MRLPSELSDASLSHLKKKPNIAASALICEGARLIGDVQMNDQSSVWFNCVLRADVGRIVIGERSNIQDLTMCHMTTGLSECIIGAGVTVGHSSVLHGCIIADNVLVGMGSILLDGCEIGEYSLIAAGTLIPPGKKIPPYSKVVGSPGKVVGELSEAEREYIAISAKHYVDLSRRYL